MNVRMFIILKIMAFVSINAQQEQYIMRQKKFVKYSLEEAAKILEMPKSTLDNYFDQIKKARETNFDFNRHKDEPYSFLCVHNREKKDQDFYK